MQDKTLEIEDKNLDSNKFWQFGESEFRLPF